MGEGVRAAFGLAGGLALFLFGMENMSRALQQAAGERMRGFLRRITRTPLTGALAGLLVTAVLQSSSATTVMVIGFVSAGLMELPQAVAVVFGANVGTTMTAQLVAFRLADWVFPILFAGVLVWLLARRERTRQLGLAVFSFGLLFDGIEVLSGAMAPLAEHPVFLRWMTQVRHTPLLGLLLGTGMTLVVQSSSATIAVLQRAAQQAGPDGIHSVLGLAGALPILLGDNIGTTITDKDQPEALPMLKVDEPTLTMNFQVNTSPLAGREGKFVTSRQIRERLERELKSNVAMRMRPTKDETVWEIAGRGELHLTILLENMRREGYELAVSRPRVVLKEIDGVKMEPYELLTVDVEEEHQGAVMEELGRRRGDLQDMAPDGKGRVRLEYRIPARGLIGFQSMFMTMCRGTGIMSHVFDDYGPIKTGDVGERRSGVIISQDDGEAVAYALWKIQERGRLFVSPGDKLYEGMIIGDSRENDIVVNPIRGKQLTNIRASGTDEAIRLVPPVKLTLESAVEFINDDELVEITPLSIRLRKRFLKDFERKRAARADSKEFGE